MTVTEFETRRLMTPSVYQARRTEISDGRRSALLSVLETYWTECDKHGSADVELRSVIADEYHDKVKSICVYYQAKSVALDADSTF